YRLQLALSARHRGPDRGRGRGAETGRSRLADIGAGQGQQGRALRADADAGVAQVSSPVLPGRPSNLDHSACTSTLPSTGSSAFADDDTVVRGDESPYNSIHDPLPHPSPDADALPQLSRGGPADARRHGGAG